MRILHVVPYYEQAWAYGGIPRLAATLTRSLADRGHDVTVCTTDACDAASRLPHGSSAHQALPRLDVRVFPNLSNRLAYHWQFFTPMGFARFLRSDEVRDAAFDVAHLHACHNLLTALSARAMRRLGVPVVVAPNGTAPAIERRVAAKRVFAATAERGLLHSAARVLAVSEAERTQLVTLGVAPSRIALLPNPIDSAEFTPPPDPARFRRAHGLEKRRLVLFLGKLTPRKGVDVLVEAFARLPGTDTALVVAGNDMGSAAAVDTLATRLLADERFVRTGLLRGRDRLDALAAADVVVYPSRDEVFGLVAAEALMAGTPVVVCDDSGCGEMIARVGGGTTVRYGDVAALAAAIGTILDGNDAWRSRARDAAVRIRNLFDAGVVAERLEAIYQDVAGQRSVRERQTA